MNLIAESIDIGDYLNELYVVNYSHESIKKQVALLFSENQTDIDKVKIAFEYVRDQIAQSLDIQSQYVPCRANEVLKYGEGVCFAKANLLAALLRSQSIPTGFCYQRLLINGTDNRYALHALNAVFIPSISKWIRLDARGNCKGVYDGFSIDKEILPYKPDELLGEKDYPIIYAKPNVEAMSVLELSTDAHKMFREDLPCVINV
ncbi:transglutaminase family protein [Lysinibacillus sp. SGAir0095]|uniref:transglutaminase-like domain-containing protein n=1 Tax=Lysinibacillus sp. SGAir0095 TaxID=2070463 RepID=UPI0010CD57D5|nr:transglutaminase family protein [Lysinibacillus sp. SGAir0095]QCR32630.1 transglutaminase [Lysinibacillus sp. SGAir0095]